MAKTKSKALEEIKDQLDQGIQELMTSEKFHKWLQFLSSFHSYNFISGFFAYRLVMADIWR
ncbi:hypothetical protein LIT25_26365 (plasmid) [Bacillus sp. F19]|nr:hypothetical protein LIT25_26365 [Bacillus sp. F19]